MRIINVCSNSKGIDTAEWFVAKDRSAAVGACLLSAAELDSSKQYLLDKAQDRWNIAYQLPVADGILGSLSIGLQIQQKGDPLLNGVEVVR